MEGPDGRPIGCVAIAGRDVYLDGEPRPAMFISDPAVLRALVLEAYDANRARGYSFLNVGLDVKDPLAAGLKGLLAQPTDVWLCVATLGGQPPPLDGRPSHHELALV